MRVLKVLKKIARKSDGAEDDLKAAIQLKDAAIQALAKSYKLIVKVTKDRNARWSTVNSAANLDEMVSRALNDLKA